MVLKNMPRKTKKEKLEELSRELRNLKVKMEFQNRAIEEHDRKRKSMIWRYEDLMTLIKETEEEIKKLKKQ